MCRLSAVIAGIAGLLALEVRAPGPVLSAAPADPTSALSGVVVAGGSTRPLAGAVVSLRGARVNISLATLTDSKGRFVFTDLPTFDHYELSATLAGYVSGELARQALSAGASLSLADGEWRADLRLEMLPLGSISGTVLDERGQPVVNAPVSALTRILFGGTSHWARGPSTRTDDRGDYHIGDLSPGVYVINVPSVYSTVPETVPLANLSGLSQAAAGPQVAQVASVGTIDGHRQLVGQYATLPIDEGNAQSYPQVFYPAARSLADATPIELSAGERRRGVVVALSAQPSRSVSGRVVGPPDAIAGITVRLFPVASESLGPGAEQATAMTVRNGDFTFVGVPSGSYVLQAGKSVGYLGARGVAAGVLPRIPSPGAVGRSAVLFGDAASLMMEAESPDDAYFAREMVDVGIDDIRGLEVVLTRGATVSGQVVRDDGVALPAGVRVWVESSAADPRLGRRAAETESIAGGALGFLVKGLPPGEYTLRVLAPNLPIKSIASGKDITGRSITVDPGEEIANVVIVLTDQTVNVSGALHEADGRPASGAAVIVFPVDRTQWSHYGFSSTHIASRVSFGPERYNFRGLGLPAGEYYIIAVDTRFQHAWEEPSFLDAAARKADRVTLTWGKETRLDLTVRRDGVR